MWIYDGEEWTEEGVNERQKKTDQARQQEERFQPELELEIIPTSRPDSNPPPPPMP